jgi:hypothetical protein
MLLTFI